MEEKNSEEFEDKEKCLEDFHFDSFFRAGLLGLIVGGINPIESNPNNDIVLSMASGTLGYGFIEGFKGYLYPEEIVDRSPAVCAGFYAGMSAMRIAKMGVMYLI